MNWTPYNYEQVNIATSSFNPYFQTYDETNQAFSYWQRSLYERLISRFDFDFNGIWENEIKDFIIYFLIRRGFLGVAYFDKFGLSAQPCTIKGMGWYYQPTEFIVTNPALKESKTFTIGTDGCLLKITKDYFGLFDIINYYANRLAKMDKAINVSLDTALVPYVVGGKTKSAVSAIKKIWELVSKGKAFVAYDQRISEDIKNEEPFHYLDLFNKNRYVLDSQLRDFETILREFDCEIGIPTIPYEKKERLVESESESKEIESQARITNWINTLNESFEKINEMFDVNMSVQINQEKEKTEDEQDNTNRNE